MQPPEEKCLFHHTLPFMTKQRGSSAAAASRLHQKFGIIDTIVTCVTIWMNLLEFVKVLCLKSVAIMQTNLCSGDLEMLFTTL